MTIQLNMPNSPVFKARMKVCNLCQERKERTVLGWVVAVCGACNCPVKNKCISAAACPKGNW